VKAPEALIPNPALGTTPYFWHKHAREAILFPKQNLSSWRSQTTIVQLVMERKHISDQ